MADKKIDINALDLEEAMNRLDEVTQKLSSDGLDLEAALALYEEGVALVRVCNTKLESAERRISMIRMSPDGEITTQPFAQDAE